MTNRDKINFLKQYIALGHEFDELYDSYARCKAKYANIQAVPLSDMPKGSKSSGDVIGGCVGFQDWIWHMEDNINIKLDTLEKLRTQIENSIGNIHDSDQRRVLRLRYIDGYGWKSICVKINYSWRQTYYIHCRAIKNIVI